MNDNEWRRMYEGNWSTFDSKQNAEGSVLNLKAIEEMAAKFRALPRLTLREIVITRLVIEPIKVTIQETRGAETEDAEYILIHPTTWAEWRSIIFDASTPYSIGALYGIPVIESDERARELLLKALEKYLPKWSPVATLWGA